MIHSYTIKRQVGSHFILEAHVWKGQTWIGTVRGYDASVVYRSAEALASLNAVKDTLAPEWRGEDVFKVDDGR